MIKRRLLVLVLLLCIPTFAFADGIYVGTPKGFYEDIDPNSLDEDEDIVQPEIPEVASPTQRENEIIIPPTRTKATKDYAQIYNDLEVPSFSYLHDIDPDQYYDMKDTAWSPYPLMRLNSPIYFKSITIEPGYYLLTPRQYKGDWFILFKEAGKVKYTIPVFEKNYTSPDYYHTHLKELDMKKSQRWMVKFLNGVGKYFKKSKRNPGVKTNLELTDLDNKFLLIEIYYGPMRYKTIFRTDKF